jgi:hypothetical protein
MMLCLEHMPTLNFVPCSLPESLKQLHYWLNICHDFNLSSFTSMVDIAIWVAGDCDGSHC